MREDGEDEEDEKKEKLHGDERIETNGEEVKIK